ncbi:MAG: T9SS type A sorting domain-containing protein [Bacteroidetes Order II. Incertae sedis bacterium]|nr:T9SS type A sorting domain-containing protein [Bacteroidetes Order II. bacterium]
MKTILSLLLFFASFAQAQNWIHTSTGLYSGHISDLVALPNGQIFAATATAGVFASEDGGNSWKALNRQLGNLWVQQLDTDTKGVLWARTGEDDDPVWYTLDTTYNVWQEVKDVQTPLFKTKNPAILPGGLGLKVNNGHLQHSANGGHTWQGVNRPEGYVVVSVAISTNGDWLAGTPNGLWRSADSGQTWQKAHLTAFESHAFLRDTDGSLLLVSPTNGIWRSKNEGRSWVATTPTTTPFIEIQNGTWVAAEPGVFRTSTDQGQTWQDKATFHATVTAFSVVQDCWMVGTAGKGLWISEDGGLSGKTFGFGQTVTALAQSGAILLAAWQEGGLVRSDDGGKTWKNTTTPFRLVHELKWVNEKQVLAHTSRGTYFSEDGGENWKTATHPTGPLDAGNFYAARNGQIFAINNDFIWTSTDRGATWTTLAPNTIGATALVLNKDGYLLAGTQTDGVYRLDRAVSVANEAEVSPQARRLQGNFPNPFHSETTIQYQLSASENVRLQVFDVQGRLRTTLQDGPSQAGLHTLRLTADNLPNGTYVLVLQTPKTRETQNLTVVR